MNININININIVEKIDDLVKVQHVLVSVFNKKGLDVFIPSLLRINPELLFYSTGGTYREIADILGKDAKKHLVKISDYTGQPEMQGGLVKTLDFKIYLGILSETYNDAHKADIKRVRGVEFDMVVANLYPFVQAIQSDGVTPEKARANIDIGGPCMIRASAKNFLRVASVVDPNDYERITAVLEQFNGSINLLTRYVLAVKAFTHTAEYDIAIGKYMKEKKFDEVLECYRGSNA